MQDSSGLDELDLALVNAVQIAPRGSWQVLGAVLGVDPSTVARRWQRITEQGLVWMTAYARLTAPSAHVLGCVEIDCLPAERDGLATLLARLPQVVSVHHVGSGRDLFVIINARSLPALSRFVLDELSHQPGVRRTSVHTATTVYGEGAHWRLNALTPAQRAELAEHAPPRARQGVLTEQDRDLLVALSIDGRRSVAELATLTGTSVSTARRRLVRLVDHGLVSIRCEVAQSLTGWPISAIFWANVPPDELSTVGRILATLPEIRFCAAVTGRHNLVMIVWLRSPEDSQHLEERLAARLPSLSLAERAITLHQLKRQSRLLDDLGRCTEVVPTDPWADLHLAPHEMAPDFA
ncbi:DNA-binding transcriptional regulator, Lrp family [Saccharopolyspora shandongensis]|uniref:DNA-binding transcriptional regulator, Lrp family n=1 Tax=Saccharopolyspora shandongensis TaxID=418495 RepID=A0A1H3RQD2_9PSEU|nr:Lrp/AsnC ligand binding domain-containing protein [Saccharopolyspora shandongensis]SDZ27575.1 DNA-binding transcriptional regulator, Lrp family [Saccharopolyspora shandongensis]